MSRKNEFTEAVDKAIGVKIHELKIAKGLSNQQVASKLGITHQQFAKYLNNTNRISAGRLADIARVLDVPVADLFDKPDAPELPDEGKRMCMEVSRNFMRIKDSAQQNAISILTRTLAN